MTTDEVIRYVLSFLGGGVVSGGMAWAREALSARRRQEVDHLQRQLQSLYGPLHFFTTQDVELLDLANRFHAAYRAEDALHRRQMRDTLLLANQYVERVDRNNEKIMGILESNWYLIDPDDTEVFAGFQVNYTRLRTVASATSRSSDRSSSTGRTKSSERNGRDWISYRRRSLTASALPAGSAGTGGRLGGDAEQGRDIPRLAVTTPPPEREAAPVGE